SGIFGDIRRRLPHYVSDFVEGLHPKCIASTIFLFFACLAPTITFGALMAGNTENSIGAVEMLLATAIGGVIYALFSAQPLVILGTTGPILAYITVLKMLCDAYELEFLPAFAWIGIWTGGLTLLLAIFNASFLMRYFTRFTDEVFAALISLIFITGALTKFYNVFHEGDNEGMAGLAVGFLSLLLGLGTLYIATSLQRMKRGRFLVPWMREFLSDFGPTIAIVSMSFVALQFADLPLKEIQVPSKIGPTIVGRSWIVNPFDAPRWVWFAASVPGLLGAVLVYLDQNITARLVNSPDNQLRKGGGYHWDLTLIGLMAAIFSLFGLPWLVAATVRSLNHVRSLADSEERVTPEGERRDRIIHVRETRVTAFAIHVLIGLSILAVGYLKMVPMAVLYGLFLFMGLASLKGNQFFERLTLWFTDSNLYPATHYMRRVPVWRIHVFTFVQLLCLASLWLVKSGPALVAIFFPLFIAFVVPVRMLLSRFYPKHQLDALDAEELPEDDILPG
ncbi:MAG: sodium bicarbonate transporter family protein, partial [Planctomycetota bacterium]